MRLGYELIKEQLFFRRELKERVHWFIHLRWIAGVGGLTVCWGLYYFFEKKIPIFPITIIFSLIILYNFIFFYIWRRLKSLKIQEVKPFTVFANIQITLDLLALFGMIYFTGGIYSPILIFVIFHIILTGILLSPVSCFVYAILVLIAVGILAGIQKTTILPYQTILFQSSLFPYRLEFPNVLILYITYITAILITAFLITSIKLSLRTKGRELLWISKELDASNAKLTALYEMVKEMGSCTELQQLMNLATRKAAKIMGVKGCSIKLLDDKRKKLKFASTYGLSEDYIAKGSVDVEKSPVNRKIIEGSFYTIGEIDEKDYFQYPEDIRKEGIASMICLPLRVEKMVLGVFCIYGEISNYFSDKDVEFFSLMAELTALAIENLKNELNRTWFLQKAAHQLRSPLNAVCSMLGVIRKGYLGPFNQEQKEMITRCEKRINILGDVISDLLKLGIERSDTYMTALHPVNINNMVNALMNFYRTQGLVKKVDITFDIDKSVPKIMGDEKLVDELLSNLISNAIKYTPSGGKVHVVLAPEDQDRVKFEVSDTGIGIPEEEIPRLFSEFFRAENAKEFTEEGTGLGLVIVKEILDRLQGTISVKSRVGEGTRFICFLRSI